MEIVLLAAPISLLWGVIHLCLTLAQLPSLFRTHKLLSSYVPSQATHSGPHNTLLSLRHVLVPSVAPVPVPPL